MVDKNLTIEMKSKKLSVEGHGEQNWFPFLRYLFLFLGNLLVKNVLM